MSGHKIWFLRYNLAYLVLFLQQWSSTEQGQKALVLIILSVVPALMVQVLAQVLVQARTKVLAHRLVQVLQLDPARWAQDRQALL